LYRIAVKSKTSHRGQEKETHSTPPNFLPHKYLKWILTVMQQGILKAIFVSNLFDNVIQVSTWRPLLILMDFTRPNRKLSLNSFSRATRIMGHPWRIAIVRRMIPLGSAQNAA
jgi:hypothetical protein